MRFRIESAVAAANHTGLWPSGSGASGWRREVLLAYPAPQRPHNSYRG